MCITSRNAGFDIFTQNKNSFKLLRSYKAFNTTAEICVSSQDKNVVIYLESGKNMNTKKAVFAYRTVFSGNGHGSRRPKDCKICSRKELIKSFCNSDFGKFFELFVTMLQALIRICESNLWYIMKFVYHLIISVLSSWLICI